MVEDRRMDFYSDLSLHRCRQLKIFFCPEVLRDDSQTKYGKDQSDIRAGIIDEVGEEQSREDNKNSPRRFDCDERREEIFMTVDKFWDHNQMCSLMMKE